MALFEAVERKAERVTMDLASWFATGRGSDSVPFVTLRNSNLWWLGVTFDPAVGRGRVHRLADGVGIAGWAYWTRFKWHALWNNGGRLCLQVGGRQWFVDEGWTASVEDHGPFRVFTVARGSERVLTRRYSRLRVGLRAMLDDDDGELGDFFLWASRTWSDKGRQEHLLQVWKEAGPDRSR
jgi:hypothetical protein